MIYIVRQCGGCVGNEWQAVRGVYDTLESAEDRQAELTTRIVSSGDYVFHYNDLDDEIEIQEYELNQNYNDRGDTE